MSRAYRIDVTVDGLTDRESDAIEGALSSIWPFADSHTFGTTTPDAWVWSGCADGSLCGGETFERMAERLTLAVWRVTQRWVPVIVRGVCIDPEEQVLHSADRYQRAVAGGELRQLCDQCGRMVEPEQWTDTYEMCCDCAASLNEYLRSMN